MRLRCPVRQPPGATEQPVAASCRGAGRGRSGAGSRRGNRDNRRPGGAAAPTSGPPDRTRPGRTLAVRATGPDRYGRPRTRTPDGTRETRGNRCGAVDRRVGGGRGRHAARRPGRRRRRAGAACRRAWTPCPRRGRLPGGTVSRAGLRAAKVEVEVLVDDPPHRTWSTIRALLEAADLPDGVRRRALAAFGRLAEAEGRVHGVPPESVHFHEVGALDAIADVVGACAGVEALGAADGGGLPRRARVRDGPRPPRRAARPGARGARAVPRVGRARRRQGRARDADRAGAGHLARRLRRAAARRPGRGDRDRRGDAGHARPRERRPRRPGGADRTGDPAVLRSPTDRPAAPDDVRTASGRPSCSRRTSTTSTRGCGRWCSTACSRPARGTRG